MGAKSRSPMPLYSLIVPTRGRTGGLKRLLDSIRATAQEPESIEVVAVIDQDDMESLAFMYPDLCYRPVVVPGGLTMGELNLAGHRASRGQYMMLLNDDVVVHTAGWDVRLRPIMEYFADGIVLAHVNDLIFGDSLCTFPLLSREFCELAGGISRPEYRRYRIDDHIHHVFDLIHVLGYTRRIYLPDVVFEHCNIAARSSGMRQYVPDPPTQALDNLQFENLIAERRRVALDCVERIEGRVRVEVRASRARRLENSGDSITLRKREHARIWRFADPMHGGQITVAVLAPSAHAVHGCLEALRAISQELPLIVVPCRNDALTICRSDYLVLLDADLRITPGWVGSLSHVVGSGAGIVVGEGCLAIDITRCGHLRFEEDGQDCVSAYLERARSSGFAVVEWPVGHSHLQRSLPPPRPPLVPAGATLTTSSMPVRVGRWLWRMLAMISARWPWLSRLRLGVPPVLVDEEWYRRRYHDVARSGVRPMLHYLRVGGFQGYNPNPHFDSNWYLLTYPDVAASGLNPLVHFVQYGAREGRNPNLFFDVHYYARQHPEVADTGTNELEHFLSVSPSERQSPNAGLTLAQYLSRLEPAPRAAPVVTHEPVPLSIIIPTRNRSQKLARTLDACRRHGGGCDLELVVVDDGSTDDTPELLRERSAVETNLSWHSLPPGGPGRARNYGAAMARKEVLLFMGDDIVPANDDFFRVHARLHAEHPELDFAVVGRISWPEPPDFQVSFTMARSLEDGSQFAFSRLTPGGFAGWQFFYTSNVSVKKSLVEDWMADGFDAGFPGAALEDMELAYRLWQSPTGLRLYYDPASLGLHDHVYSLEAFLERQFFVGQSLRRMLELHPELMDEYGLGYVANALLQPAATNDGERLRVATSEIERIEAFAKELELHGRLGAEPWHAALVSALFQSTMHNGYASCWSPGQANLAAARQAILERLQRFLPRIGSARDR